MPQASCLCYCFCDLIVPPLPPPGLQVKKLEQLVKLKDAKIQTLMAKLQAAGLA